MKWIVGIDEVGRGPLAGPVCICAFAMPQTAYSRMKWVRDGVESTDSKLMTAAGREQWNAHLQSMKRAGLIRIGIARSTAAQIDEKGIAPCIRSCIKRVLAQLDLDPSDCVVLLDGGLRAPVIYKKQGTFIKGDRIHKIIGAASVVAKVARDQYMVRMDRTYPGYGWATNKGYGTTVHGQGIKRLGLTPLHRKSFLSRYLTK